MNKNPRKHMKKTNSVVILSVAIICIVGASVFVYSAINYNEVTLDKTAHTSKQVFENKKMKLTTPEIDPQYCEELKEKNSTIGKWESDQERNDVRQTLANCQREKDSLKELDEIIFEGCEQFKEEYDGKIFQKTHDEKGIELIKHTLNDCKLRK